MIVKLHPEAQIDLKEALDYYFSIDPKLEKKFIDKLDLTFSKLKLFANIYPFETKTAQKCLMKDFGYIIIYEKYENIIMILAIFHTSRDSKDLENREVFKTKN